MLFRTFAVYIGLGFMDSQLLILSKFLVGIAFWVGVPFSLVGMLLLLGFKSKHAMTAAIAVIGIAGLSCWGLGLSIEGLVTGEALSISRHWGVVDKVHSPTGYWAAMAFWFLLSVIVLGGCCWALGRLAKTLTNHLRGAPKSAP